MLGLDVGERRIGVAISDPAGRFAVPKATLRRDGKELTAIETLVREEGIERLVIGLPLSMSGDEGPQAAATRRFGAWLDGRLPVPLHYWDERLSTVAAQRLVIGERGRARERVDALAATLILQSYLDSLRESGEP